MEKFIPDIYQKSIYRINYDSLKTNGIKCLLFDLDNTIASIEEEKPSQKVIDLFEELKDKGFKIIIFSNAPKKRIKPFKDILEVDCASRCFKPRKTKFNKVINLFNLKECEIAIIGDLQSADIYGGNRVGITTILVNPISTNDRFSSKILRSIDKRIIKRLNKKDLFKKGEYYE